MYMAAVAILAQAKDASTRRLRTPRRTRACERAINVVSTLVKPKLHTVFTNCQLRDPIAVSGLRVWQYRTSIHFDRVEYRLGHSYWCRVHRGELRGGIQLGLPDLRWNYIQEQQEVTS